MKTLAQKLAKNLVLSLFVLIFTVAYGFCSIRITPTYVELDANKTKKDYLTGSFNVRGAPEETIRFKVYPKFFDITNKGKLVVVSDKERKESLVERVKFFPSEFTSKNGRNQKVRFTVTNLKKLQDGESRLVFFLEDVNTREVFINSKDGKYKGRIIVKTRVGVPVYVDKGKYIKKGNFDRVALKQNKDEYICEYKISSVGNSKIRYKAKAQLIKGKELIEEFDLPSQTVGANSFIEVAQKIKLDSKKIGKNGEYKLKVILSYENEKQKEKYLTKEITFKPSALIGKSI